jgi:GH35 family endo-1,4-beta-xylanase
MLSALGGNFMKKNAFLLCLAAIAAYAQTVGLKDVYADYFPIGTCYPSNQTNNTELRDVILREFNSITHENELKPDATMVQTGSTDEDIKVQLRDGAKYVMQFCVTNGIPLRGHTLVWHRQTPDWFFYANMQSGSQSSLATKEVMLKRLDSYIKNIFALINQEFPTLNLYAYDVVNEIFRDNGNHREAGFGDSEKSPWVSVFGDNSFADSAFVYARKYAPAGCKLFYNDYNEYHPDGKMAAIVTMATRLKEQGVLDGIGMQSHLSTNWPSATQYKTALTNFLATGSEVHVTELDITIDTEKGHDEAKQAEVYEGIFKILRDAKDEGKKVTSVSVWGVRDDLSWRNNGSPLLFTQNYTKKPAYNSVVSVITSKGICEYQSSFCNGIEFANVQGNSTAVPVAGDCLFIGDFERIQPTLNSTVSINGLSNTCGNSWGDCSWNDVPPQKDGGYYVYVREGTINSPDGWLDVVAKAKPSCNTAVGDPSSSSGGGNSSSSGSGNGASSSSDGSSPIRMLSSIPNAAFQIRAMSDGSLLIDAGSQKTVEVYDIKGNKVVAFNVLRGLQKVNLSLPSGVYFAKAQGLKVTKFMLK